MCLQGRLASRPCVPRSLCPPGWGMSRPDRGQPAGAHPEGPVGTGLRARPAGPYRLRNLGARRSLKASMPSWRSSLATAVW